MFRGGKFSSKERQLINQFVAITSTSERQAAEALKRNGWQLEPSLESYFNHVGSYAPPKVDPEKLEAFFGKYKDEDGDLIGIDGIIKLCEDMKIDPETDVVCPPARTGSRSTPDGPK